MKWNRKQMAWMRKAAKGRVTVANVCAGPEEGFAPRYLPKVAGEFVSMPGRPQYGYFDADAARSAAIAYKHQCIIALREAGQK